MTINRRRPQPIPSAVVVALTITSVLFSPVSVECIRPGGTVSNRASSLSRTSLRSPGLPMPCISLSPSRSSHTQLFDSSSPPDSREEEIRKKIEKLKEEGRLGKSQASSEASPETSEKKRKSAYDDYADKVQGKLGKRQG